MPEAKQEADTCAPFLKLTGKAPKNLMNRRRSGFLFGDLAYTQG